MLNKIEKVVEKWDEGGWRETLNKCNIPSINKKIVVDFHKNLLF